MFPTFDVPPQHAETVGARKVRRAKEDNATRRSSTSTSQSSGSANSTAANSKRQDASISSSSKSGERSGFSSWFSKSSKKGVQEISPLSTTDDTPSPKEVTVEPEPDVELDQRPTPPTAPLDVQDHVFPRPPSQRCEKQTRPLQPQRFPPPLSPLPSRPPTAGLPPTPSSGLLSPISISDRKSQYSLSSRASSNLASTTHSNQSVYSATSGYETAISDVFPEDLQHSSVSARYQHLRQGPVFEAVERGSRTGSRQSNEPEQSARAAQSPFARALAKIDSAGTRIMSARLSEEWEGLDDDESFQEIMFEKRLWALTAYQRLTQNKSLQSPAHELLVGSRPEDQRRVLQIHGSIADGWILANRYPTATIYTLSSKKAPPATAYPAPLNHHSLYVPSLSSPTPFPDNYFDAIISRSIATVLRNDEWARSFFDCMRVLKPGGQIEILSVDAHMSREGPKMSSWVDEHLSCRLESNGVSKQASDTVLDTMEIVGLDNIRRARIALPAQPPRAIAKTAPAPSHTFGAAISTPTPQDTLDNTKMMAFLGRHFYQDLYGKFMHTEQGDEWFWALKDIRDELNSLLHRALRPYLLRGDKYRNPSATMAVPQYTCGHARIGKMIEDMEALLPSKSVKRQDYVGCRTTYGALSIIYKRVDDSDNPEKGHQELRVTTKELRRRLINLDPSRGLPRKVKAPLDELDARIENALKTGVTIDFVTRGLEDILKERPDATPAPKLEPVRMVPERLFNEVSEALKKEREKSYKLNEEVKRLTLELKRY
ncbi:hypothetical protein TW65_04186 [Stemphylium lycopersici]|nr:hypothetical protein TW65_04186 [Stemphylium lycopersici]